MRSTFVIPDSLMPGRYDIVPGMPGTLPMTLPESSDGNRTKTDLIRKNDQNIKMQQGMPPDPHRAENPKEKQALMAGIRKLIASQEQQQKPGTISAKNLDFSKPFS